MFLYYNARALEGNENNPAVGTGIRSGLKALRRYGVCNEKLWPYEMGPAPLPDGNIYNDVIYKGLVQYHRVFRLDTRGDIAQLNLDPVRRAIRDDDLPVICGFTAFPSFLDAYKEGVGGVGLPGPNDLDFLGADPDPAANPANGAVNRITSFGHAAVIIGYQSAPGDDRAETGTFILANSWGEKFGTGGIFTMPARYLANAALASDFWTIKSLETADVSNQVRDSAGRLLYGKDS